MSGRLVGASALLLVLQHSCWCFGTPVGVSTLLLVLRNSCCVGNHVLIGAPALLLHEQARPDWCFDTPAGATTLLLRGQTHPVRCYGTSVLYCTFEYLLYRVLLISYDWSR